MSETVTCDKCGLRYWSGHVCEGHTAEDDCPSCGESKAITERDTALAKLEEVRGELAKRESDFSWICRKLKVPDGTKMFDGPPTIAGELHVLDSNAKGYLNYIAAFKCDDKQGEIARQSVRIGELESDLVAARASLAEARRVIEPFLRYQTPSWLADQPGIKVRVEVTLTELKAAHNWLAKNQPDNSNPTEPGDAT